MSKKKKLDQIANKIVESRWRGKYTTESTFKEDIVGALSIGYKFAKKKFKNKKHEEKFVKKGFPTPTVTLLNNGVQ